MIEQVSPENMQNRNTHYKISKQMEEYRLIDTLI